MTLNIMVPEKTYKKNIQFISSDLKIFLGNQLRSSIK